VSDYMLNGSPMLRRFIVSWLRSVIRQTPSFANGASSAASSPFDHAATTASATAYLATASNLSPKSSSSATNTDTDQCMRWALELLVSQLHAPLSLAAASGSGSHTKSAVDGNSDSVNQTATDDESTDPQLCEENAIAVSALSVLDEVTRFSTHALHLLIELQPSFAAAAVAPHAHRLMMRFASTASGTVCHTSRA
jgi:hypothetical protein